MDHQIIFAGFGGQGVMLIGTLLTYAGMEQGKAVSWLPSYGPEMRGGTANCSVCVSDTAVASPVIAEPTAIIAMNLPSYEKFADSLLSGGCLIVNSDLADVKNSRQDIDLFAVPANTEAKNLGSDRVANMICLGALLGARDIVPLDAVINALPKVIQEKYHHLLELNTKALERGFELAKTKG